jgi:hypothetical protein
MVSSVSSLKKIFTQSLVNDRHLRHKVILASSNIQWINDKEVTFLERKFLSKMNSTKRAKPKRTAEEVIDLRPQVIPHLPPYASQYRDLMLHQIAKARD